MRCTNRNRSVASVVIASASLAIITHASRADVLHLSQPGVAAGHAVMLGLRMPLGARRTSEAEAKLTLAYGPSWRAAPGDDHSSGRSFTPRFEASVTLGENPVAQFDLLDAMNRIARRASAEGDQNSANGNRARNVFLALMGAGALVWTVNGLVDTYEWGDEHYDAPQDR